MTHNEDQASTSPHEPEDLRWVGYVKGKMQRGGASQYLIVPTPILEMLKVGVGDRVVIPYGWIDHPPGSRPPLWMEQPLRAMGATSAGFLVPRKYLDLLNLPEGGEVQVPVMLFRRPDDPRGDRVRALLAGKGAWPDLDGGA